MYFRSLLERTASVVRTMPLLLAAFTACALLCGCPRETLKYANVSISAATASPGETVTIQWDFENANLLVSHSVQAFFLTITGLQQTEPEELEVTDRSFSFEFSTPVTVLLSCKDENGFADQVAFDVRLDDSFVLTATFRSPTDTEYPRLGYDQNRENQIFFSQFLAFFDPPAEENGLVDAVSGILPSDGFFRGFTTGLQETIGVDGFGRFGFSPGTLYPLAVPTDPSFGQANAMVFGGALAYDGELFPIKAELGEIFGRRGRGLTFEPMFLAIAYRIDFDKPSAQLLEIATGNLNQGLVLPLAFGLLQLSPPSARFVDLDSASLDFDTDGTENGIIEGFIKSSRVGFPITTAQGDIFDTFVNIDSIQFRTPFLLDKDFAGRLNFGPAPVKLGSSSE